MKLLIILMTLCSCSTVVKVGYTVVMSKDEHPKFGQALLCDANPEQNIIVCMDYQEALTRAESKEQDNTK